MTSYEEEMYGKWPKRTYNNIKHWFKDLFHKINNLFYWFPIIWNDYDWDHDFLMKMIQHKLESMERYFMSDKPQTEDAQDHAVVMREIIVCMNRINNDDYHNLDEFYEKFGLDRYAPIEFVQDEDDPRLSRWVDRFTQEQKDSFMKYSKKDMDEEQADWDKIFDLLKTNIRSFWD